MGSRIILTAQDGAKQKLADGILKATDIVRVTLGVKGRNVALDTDKYRGPLLTNDGVSILREIHFEDPAEELGKKLLQEAAGKTEDNAGDGTTTTAILTNGLVQRGVSMSKTDPLEIRRLFTVAVAEIVDWIRTEAEPAKDAQTLAYTATISSRDQKIGEMIGDIVSKAGDDGMITLEDNLGGNTETEQLDGLQLRTGFRARQFVNNPALNQVEIKHPSFLVTNNSLSNANELDLIATKAIEAGHKILVILAQDIGPEFVLWCYANWVKQDSPIKVLPVPFSTAADLADGMLRDVAAITGAKFIDATMGEGLDKVDQECFGRGDKFVQTKKITTIIANNKSLTKARIKELKGELKDTDDYMAENIKERIARLQKACFTIRVGGVTETELRERKTRVQDALNAARGAYAEGVVKGGGVALAKAGAGTAIKSIMKLPAKQLADNSSISLEVWLRTVEADKTIIDPARVLIEAVKNSAAQAIQVLLTEHLIIDEGVNQ